MKQPYLLQVETFLLPRSVQAILERCGKQLRICVLRGDLILDSALNMASSTAGGFASVLSFAWPLALDIGEDSSIHLKKLKRHGFNGRRLEGGLPDWGTSGLPVFIASQQLKQRRRRSGARAGK